MNKSTDSAASSNYVKLQALIESAASAASLRGGRASGRLDHGFFWSIFGRASAQKLIKISVLFFGDEFDCLGARLSQGKSASR